MGFKPFSRPFLKVISFHYSMLLWPDPNGNPMLLWPDPNGNPNGIPIRKELRSSGLIEKYTVRELLQEMKTLTKVKYSGKYGYILTEITKAQRDIRKRSINPIYSE